MWLSKKAIAPARKDEATVGRVTVGGDNIGVYAGSERRGVRLFAPKGVIWKPKPGQELLLVELHEGGTAALGMEMDAAPSGMAAGEICITSDGGAVIYLKNDGSVVLSGNVKVEGSLSVNGVSVE